jgi:AbiU2
VSKNEPPVVDVFKRFREECIWLQSCYNTYKALYVGPHAVRGDLLWATAPIFFYDLSVILVDYIYLLIGRVTDPATTRGQANLTVAAIDTMLAEAGLITDAIKNCSTGMHRYRELIKPARDKLIAHLDRDTVLAAKTLGEHSPEEARGFFDNLHRYIDEVGIAIGVGPLDISGTGASGDALDLLKVLRHGVSAG